ncbi:MAG TPA: tetratricopeptide repeat protein [Bryobacteraceae bacterium]|nr:tetratricopeptide repeat protein [Bryobacteraceae bacterium]
MLLLLFLGLAAQSYLDRAMGKIQARQPAEAIRILTDEIKRSGGNPQAWNLLGIAEGDRNRYEEAEGAFRQSLALDARFVPAYENLGSLLLRKRDFMAARKLLDRGLEVAPGNLRILHSAAWLAESQKELDRAVALYLRARKAAPDDIPTLIHFGRVCLRRGLNEDALSALKRARELEPANHAALFFEASARAAVGELEDAYKLLLEYVRKAPANAEAYYRLGWIASKTAKLDEARQYFDKCVELHADHAEAAYELAALDLAAGNVEAAETKVRRVLTIAPNHVNALVLAGDIETTRGAIQIAEKQYRAAIAADPARPVPHYKLSRVLARLKDISGAAREQELAAELEKEARQKSRARLQIAWPETQGQ